MEYDNVTGFGPESGGFYPTAGERVFRENLKRDAVDIMDYAAIHNAQFDRLRRTVVRPMAGNQTKADEWLYNSRPGYAFRTAAAGILNRDPLGFGSPQAFAVGLQQAVGTGGMQIRDMTAPGGADRAFGGAGAVTNMITKQLFTSLQKEFFGGGQNRVGGLNQSETGVLMNELAGRGAFRGNVASLRYANVSDRIAQMGEMADPRIQRLTRGIKDDAGLEQAIKKATESGDDTLRDSLTRVRDNKQIFDIDPQAKEKIKRTTQATAKMLSTLGDMVGSTNIQKLLEGAEGIMGQAITNEQDATRAKRAIEDVRTFARGRGLDSKALLKSMSDAGGSASAALAAGGMGVVAANAVGATIGRTSTVNGIVAAGDSGFNGMTGFTAEQAQSVGAAGQIARLQENPELVAAAAFLKTGGSTVSTGDRRELQGLISSFGKAGSQDQRAAIQSKINRLIHGATGQGAMDWMGGQKGMESLLEDADIRENALSTLSDNVNASVMGRGNVDALGRMTANQRGMLGDRGDELAGLLSSSFTGSSQQELLKVLNADSKKSPKLLEQFLKAHAGALTDAQGNAVSTKDAAAMFGNSQTFKDKAAALSVYSRNFSTLGYTKTAVTEEARDREQGMSVVQMLKEGSGLEPRLRNKGFLGSLAEGLLSGPDGQLTQEALVGIASEQAGRGDFKEARSANFKLGADGNFSDVTGDKLTRLLGQEGVDRLLDKSGGDLNNLVESLNKGDGSSTRMLRDTLLGDEYAAASLDGKSLTVVDRAAKERAEEMFTEKGRRAAAAKHLFGASDKFHTVGGYVARDIFDNGEDLGQDLVSGMQNNGMIERIQKGSENDVYRLRQLDKISGGGLKQSMENAKASADAKMNDMSLAEKDRDNARNDSEKLKAGIEALQNPADSRNMRVGVLHVEKVQHAGANDI